MTLTVIEKLKLRWLKATGEKMPLSIERLSLDTIRRAVEMSEDGQQVFVPGVPVTDHRADDSLRDWDSDSNF